MTVRRLLGCPFFGHWCKESINHEQKKEYRIDHDTCVDMFNEITTCCFISQYPQHIF